MSGAHLGHRLSYDVDLFFEERGELQQLASHFADVARGQGTTATTVQNAGSFVRARLTKGDEALDVDLVVESAPALAAEQVLDNIRLVSFDDLRANKLTCLLSRSEPRDLVDVPFLDRAGFAPENDLIGAVKKDAGVDPSTLGWLLTEFPVTPLPQMLLPLTAVTLRNFRDELRERLRRIALANES